MKDYEGTLHYRNNLKPTKAKINEDKIGTSSEKIEGIIFCFGTN